MYREREGMKAVYLVVGLDLMLEFTVYIVQLYRCNSGCRIMSLKFSDTCRCFDIESLLSELVLF